MPGTSWTYRLAARCAVALVPAAASIHAKTWTGHRGRRNALERWQAWAARERRPGVPLVWFHASSVGEGLQELRLDELVARRATAREVRTAAMEKGFRPLVEEGIARILDGSTSVAEVARAVDLTQRFR